MKLNQEAKEGIITRMGDFIYLISKQSSNNLKRISLQNQTETWEEIQGPKEVFEFCACTVFQGKAFQKKLRLLQFPLKVISSKNLRSDYIATQEVSKAARRIY